MIEDFMDLYTCLIIFIWLASMYGLTCTIFFVKFVLWVTKQNFVAAIPRFTRPASSPGVVSKSDPDARESDLASINEVLDKRAAGESKSENVRVVDGDLCKETEIDGDDSETFSEIKKFKSGG